MRNPVFSGLVGAFAFFLAVSIAVGALAGKVLGDEITASPPAVEMPVACPEGSTMRQDFFDNLLAAGTGWLLHSTHTGDKLVAFWDDMPPPPAALKSFTVEAVIFQSPQQNAAAVVFFRADGCSIGHFGPVPMHELFAMLGLTEA